MLRRSAVEKEFSRLNHLSDNEHFAGSRCRL